MLNSLVNSSLTFLEPYLNNGIMFASFYSNGTIPSSNDKVNTVASAMLICSTISSSNLGRIPSTPGDLFSFISLIFIATIVGVTIS